MALLVNLAPSYGKSSDSSDVGDSYDDGDERCQVTTITSDKT